MTPGDAMALGGLGLQRSLERADYVEEERYAREQEVVLSSDWFCVGRSEALARSGEYLAVEVAGEALLVIRGADGELRCFYNLCRHRGTRLVPSSSHGPDAPGTPSGRFGRVVTCPYHAWSYGLDGVLRRAPFLPQALRLKDQLSLHEIAVESWGGFVFVRLCSDKQEPSLGERLSEVQKRLAHYRLSDLRIGRRLIYRVAANWKVILENYNECYHCGPVHPELCRLVPDFSRGGAGLNWDEGIPHRAGATTFTMSGRTDREPFPDLLPEERSRHRGELVLPNLMLSLSCDHIAAFSLWPESAAYTTVVCDFLFTTDAISAPNFDPEDAVGFWDLVNGQDWYICEQVQAGMRSRMFTVGWLSELEEPSADIGAYIRARGLGGSRAQSRPESPRRSS